MNPFLGALLIFCLRIGDVSFGTLRVIFMVRNRRMPAAAMAVCESAIYILAIARVLTGPMELITIMGYALGYAAGTAIGITIENWLAFGWVLVRVISRTQSVPMRQRLLDADFGVTAVFGEGREGKVLILFVNVRRRRADELLSVIQEVDPQAFITIEPINEAIGGYLPTMTEPTAMKK